MGEQKFTAAAGAHENPLLSNDLAIQSLAHQTNNQ
jgi:hypothetical protein